MGGGNTIIIDSYTKPYLIQSKYDLTLDVNMHIFEFFRTTKVVYITYSVAQLLLSGIKKDVVISSNKSNLNGRIIPITICTHLLCPLLN